MNPDPVPFLLHGLLVTQSGHESKASLDREEPGLNGRSLLSQVVELWLLQDQCLQETLFLTGFIQDVSSLNGHLFVSVIELQGGREEGRGEVEELKGRRKEKEKAEEREIVIKNSI